MDGKANSQEGAVVKRLRTAALEVLYTSIVHECFNSMAKASSIMLN